MGYWKTLWETFVNTPFSIYHGEGWAGTVSYAYRKLSNTILAHSRGLIFLSFHLFFILLHDQCSNYQLKIQPDE